MPSPPTSPRVPVGDSPRIRRGSASAASRDSGFHIAFAGHEVAVSPAQVVLAWNVARGVVPIPSSTDAEHVVENLAAAGVVLSADQLARVDDLADSDVER